jgi:hypothetical protein
MTVVGVRAAAEIFRRPAWVNVDVVRHPTGLAYVAIEWKSECEWRRKRRDVIDRSCPIWGRANANHYNGRHQARDDLCE